MKSLFFALNLLLASLAVAAPPEVEALKTVPVTMETSKRLEAIMANSQKLADAGEFQSAADLRAQMLEHFPGTLAPVFDEPYKSKALGQFWGIEMGDAIKAIRTGPGEGANGWGWEAVLSWYRQAGDYRGLVAAYEKLLRDPYHIFRDYEIARHRRVIDDLKARFDTVWMENLSIPKTSLINPQLEVSFEVVNAFLTPQSSGAIALEVRDETGKIAAKNTLPAIELPAQSRRRLTWRPNITRAGQFSLAVARAASDPLRGTFAFADKAAPKVLAAGRAVLQTDDSILSEGARIVAAPWSEGKKAISFPGRASFPVRVSRDSAYYLQISNLMERAYEPTPWEIWIDGQNNTPSGMHGSGPPHFVHFDVRPVAGGVQNRTFWRVPLHLARGDHTIDIALSLGQQLDSVTLVPAIDDKVVVKAVRCAAPFAMFYPNEKIDLTVTLENLSDAPLQLRGETLWGGFRQRGLGGWVGVSSATQLSHAKTYKREPLSLSIPAKGTLEIPVNYNPGEMGHIDPTFYLSDGQGVYLGMGASFARIFRPVEGPRPDSIFGADLFGAREAEFAGRLGLKRGRRGRGADFYKAAAKYGIKNVMILGQPDNLPFQPTGKRIGADTMPSPGSLPNYEKWVYEQVLPYKDQIEAVIFQNEPWEGKTYWGYSARGDHYRDVLKYLYRGVKRANPSIKVLAGDSNLNLRWNLLAEPGMERYFDGASVHYGGVVQDDPAYFRALGEEPWNTEFWFGEGADDSQVVVEHLLHLMHGYKMLNSFIPFWAGAGSGSARPRTRFESREGKLRYIELGKESEAKTPYSQYDVGSIVPVEAAMIHFLTDVDYREVVKPLTVPWAFTFTGKRDKAGQNVAVLTSNIGVGMPGDQAREKWQVYASTKPTRAFVPPQNVPQSGEFVIPDANGSLQAFDILGNPTGRRDGGSLVVPVGAEAVYLTHRGAYDEFAQLLKGGTTRKHRPFQITLHDFAAPLDAKPVLRVKLHNLYPQAQGGTVRVVSSPDIQFGTTQKPIPTLAPGAETWVEFPIAGAKINARNEYLVTVEATSQSGDKAVLSETLSVATAVFGSVQVDGDVSEWKRIGAVPQFMSDRSGPDSTFKAIDPFADTRNIGAGLYGEFATAWDEANFYFMARIHDPSHELQISNFRDFDRHLFFPYPNDYIYRTRGWAGNNSIAVHPKGVYFNIQARERTRGFKANPEDVLDPTDWRYRIGQFRTSDYDFIAYETRFGPELMKTRKDDFYFIHPLPIKTDFMRLNSQVPGNKLEINFNKKTGIVTYEGAIPWSEMPNLKPVAGRQFKLGWFLAEGVRDGLEWNMGRSTSVLNSAGFEFQGKWSTETPWSLYKK